MYVVWNSFIYTYICENRFIFNDFEVILISEVVTLSALSEVTQHFKIYKLCTG